MNNIITLNELEKWVALKNTNSPLPDGWETMIEWYIDSKLRMRKVWERYLPIGR